MLSTRYKDGDTSAHAAMAIATALEPQQEQWQARGWQLTLTNGVWDVAGDTGQFYLDAVADDVNAALVLAFLERFNPEATTHYKDQCEDDFISFDDCLTTFLRDQPLETELARRGLI